MNTQWKPINEVDPADLDKELKQLERLDVPLLHLEAILVYTPEKFSKAPTQKTLQRLADVGVLTAKTLTRWLEFSLTDTTRKILEAQLKALRAGLSAARPQTGRICCPVVIGYHSSLLPGVTLGGVRWIEVVSRGPNADVASGFSTEWPERLEELGRRVQDIIGVPLNGQRPQWRLLDSLGQRVIEAKDLARRSESLELGASLAYACWAMQLRLPYLVAATGKVTGDSIESIEDPHAKMLGLGREASHIGHILVAPKDMAACSDAGVSGTGVVPVDSLAQAVEVLRRDASHHGATRGASSSQTRIASPLRSISLIVCAIALLLAIGAAKSRWPSLIRHEPRPVVPRPHLDASAMVDRLDAPDAIQDASAVLDSTAHDATSEDSSIVRDAGDGDISDCQDVPVPCAYLAANGVCRIRMESPLFYGAWPPGLAGDIRWFLPQGSERFQFELSDRGCGSDPPTLLPVSADAGLAHVVVPVPTRPSSRRHCSFGMLFACLQAVAGGTDLFCNYIKTIIGPIGQRDRVTSIGTDGRRIDFPAQACRPTDDVAAVEMGIELSSRSSQLLANGQQGYRVTVRWSVRGVPMPVHLLSLLADRTLGPRIEGLPESGEAVLDLPIRDGGTSPWPIIICIEDATTYHLRCKAIS